MSADVLVTGVTGLIGRYVAARLLEEGRRLRVLVRDPRRLDPEVIRGARVIVGDVADPSSVARAVHGVGTVLHLAARARAWSRDDREFTRVNVEAVARLLDAARASGRPRVVHVSTVLTLPELRRSGRPATPYETTKAAGEALVERYVLEGGDAVVVHPTRVFGPGPLNDANGVTRLFAQVLDGPVVLRLDDGDVLANYVHADDVAGGILLAAEYGRPGAHYVLGGENVSLRELLRLAVEVSGARRRIVTVPRGAALAAAHAAVLWGRLGGEAPITPAWVRCYFEDHRVDLTATCRELGYRYRPLRTGLEETIRWLRSRLPAAS